MLFPLQICLINLETKLAKGGERGSHWWLFGVIAMAMQL